MNAEELKQELARVFPGLNLDDIFDNLNHDQLRKDYPDANGWNDNDRVLLGMRDGGLDALKLKLSKEQREALNKFLKGKSKALSAHWVNLKPIRGAQPGQQKPKLGPPEDPEDEILALAKELKHLPGLVEKAKAVGKKNKGMLEGAAMMTGTRDIFVALDILS